MKDTLIIGVVIPALLAVSVFATVDAPACYALLKKRKVLSFTVAIRMYALVASGARILTLVFWWLHGAMMMRTVGTIP